MIKAVIFDLDGTLLDTLQDLANAVNAALEKEHMPQHSVDDVRRFVGNGVKKLMERAIPDGENNPAFARTYQYFREYYAAHCKENTKLYPGIQELLDELQVRGIKTAIVSNKMDPAVKILNEDYFAGKMDAALGESEEVPKKPAPDMVNKVLKELQITAEEAVYVGDSDVDIATAKNSGLPCISVTWGFRSEAFLMEHGATQLVHKPKEILPLLAEMNR